MSEVYLKREWNEKNISPSGNRTRAVRVKAENPNLLDQRGRDTYLLLHLTLIMVRCYSQTKSGSIKEAGYYRSFLIDELFSY